MPRLEENSFNTSNELQTLANWCEDALTILVDHGARSDVAALKRSAIRYVRGTPKLHEIAAQLAADLHDLPEPAKAQSNARLTQRHGYGTEVFIDRAMATVMRILKDGKIRSDDDFRAVSEFASDTSESSGLRCLADNLLESYVAERSANIGSDEK